MVTDQRSLLVVGQPGPVHVGGHLAEAAESLGLHVTVLDVNRAFSGPKWLTRASWHLRDHRPLRMREFNDRVLQVCEQECPTWMLVTGIAPLDSRTLRGVGKLGIERINFLTDDPWNPVHRAGWFLESLRHYDRVFSPRQANLEDLRARGCAEVAYLPFGYAPYVHFPPRGLQDPDDERSERRDVDVVFAGAADRDRVPYMAALDTAGLSTDVYGGFWDRQPRLRHLARGIADPCALREATFSARVAVCLVRRANRDGHVMRSFEIPAVGGCMLAEDTPEHRAFFGDDGQAVVYFRDARDIVNTARWMLGNPGERTRLRRAVHAKVTDGRHTYQDRLTDMLRLTEGHTAPPPQKERA